MVLSTCSFVYTSCIPARVHIERVESRFFGKTQLDFCSQPEGLVSVVTPKLSGYSDRMTLLTCSTHGPNQPATLVCQHLASRSPSPLGFNQARGKQARRKERPDAWCDYCEAAWARNGYKWAEELADILDPKVLCAGCYDEVKEFHRKDR